jgi:ribosomal protein S18 acetylase RimI-like enzyme
MIREARIDDFNAMQEIVREIQRKHFEARPDIFNDTEEPLEKDEFEKLINDEDAIIFVKETNQGLVGYCVMKIKESKVRHIMKPSKFAYINDFAVKKSHWRKGIGRELFNHAKAFATDSGVRSLQLMVWEFNKSAVSFYEAMGMNTMLRRMELPL